jgi:hypothetical protein
MLKDKIRKKINYKKDLRKKILIKRIRVEIKIIIRGQTKFFD